MSVLTERNAIGRNEVNMGYRIRGWKEREQHATPSPGVRRSVVGQVGQTASGGLTLHAALGKRGQTYSVVTGLSLCLCLVFGHCAFEVVARRRVES